MGKLLNFGQNIAIDNPPTGKWEALPEGDDQLELSPLIDFLLLEFSHFP